ncbi:hypothetical protein AX17_007207 [Amanita inopinata Kibby_2008]|nr:hypothetical protein AX17_007207 [Amanita inopinata Kibby_2008]
MPQVVPPLPFNGEPSACFGPSVPPSDATGEHETMSSQPNIPPSIAAIINEVAAGFRQPLNILIINCTFSAMLVPLLVALFFFSTKALRRKPIFIFNVLSILLGLSLSLVTTMFSYLTATHPLETAKRSVFISSATLLGFTPLIAESILLVRLWAVHPYGKTPLKVFLIIYVPIGLIKIARTVNLSIFVVGISKLLIPGDLGFRQLREHWTGLPGYRIEWFLQVADNSLASLFFLLKLNEGKTIAMKHHAQDSSRMSYTSKLQALFWICVFNFVIPVILSIAQLIVIFLNSDVFKVYPIFLVNIYVEIIGVLLATVWAEGIKWQDDRDDRDGGKPRTAGAISLPSIRFARNNFSASSPGSEQSVDSRLERGITDAMIHEEPKNKNEGEDQAPLGKELVTVPL